MPHNPATTPAIPPARPARAVLHEVRFHTRSRRLDDARAVCTCGWFTFGALHEVQDAAANHADEWQAVEVDQHQPAAVAP